MKRMVRVDQHGTETGYTYGCRCDECKAAKAAARRRYKPNRERTVRDDQHGSVTGYQYGCRCDECTTANAIYCRAAKERRLRVIRENGGTPATVVHGRLGTYMMWNCRCDLCMAASAERHPDTIANQRAKNRETLATAARHGQQWTGAELEIAARDDLTAKQAAQMIGRSYYAVVNMRQALKEDPKIQQVLHGWKK